MIEAEQLGPPAPSCPHDVEQLVGPFLTQLWRPAGVMRIDRVRVPVLVRHHQRAGLDLLVGGVEPGIRIAPSVDDVDRAQEVAERVVSSATGGGCGDGRRGGPRSRGRARSYCRAMLSRVGAHDRCRSRPRDLESLDGEVLSETLGVSLAWRAVKAVDLFAQKHAPERGGRPPGARRAEGPPGPLGDTDQRGPLLGIDPRLA